MPTMPNSVYLDNPQNYATTGVWESQTAGVQTTAQHFESVHKISSAIRNVISELF